MSGISGRKLIGNQPLRQISDKKNSSDMCLDVTGLFAPMVITTMDTEPDLSSKDLPVLTTFR